VLTLLAVFFCCGLSAAAAGQTVTPPSIGDVPVAKVAERNIHDWLTRLQEASRHRAYVGTFVVSTGTSLSSSRIWHVCDGVQQAERVESLTGAPRSTFRHNDQVLTLLPDKRVAVAEKRETLALFSGLWQSNESSLDAFYLLKTVGTGRVAGLQTEILQLQPKDNLRFGYRVWTEKNTGLVMKLQTLNGAGQVLEQAAFSELQLDAPVNMADLTLLMGKTEGYQLAKSELVQTVAAVEGWVLKSDVPGFKPLSCQKRTIGGATGAGQATTMQWVFSDGLASVSLFVEVFDPLRHRRVASYAIGATHTLTRRIGDWWLTAVGEVPLQALLAFSQGLERSR
jgi:sigma-E factor negative regulatory protein RseB